LKIRPFLTLTIAVVSCNKQEPVRHTAPPLRADILLTSEIETIEGRVPRHSTLDTLLRANNLQETFVADAVNAARAVLDPRRVSADQPHRLVRTIDEPLSE